MIPLPKPRFAEKKMPVEISPEKKEEYYEKLIEKQSHDIENAIDRVSYFIHMLCIQISVLPIFYYIILLRYFTTVTWT